MRKICYMCKNWSEDTGVCSDKYMVTSKSDTCSNFVSIPCCGNCHYFSGTYCSMHDMRIDDDEMICRDDSWKEKKLPVALHPVQEQVQAAVVM